MLEIQKLRVEIAEKPILQNVSLRVKSGEFCCVIGPNGSGKSTLLRAIGGTISPQSDAIFWNETPFPANIAARAKLVATLPQNLGGGDEMRLEEMAMLGRTPHLPPFGAPSREDENAVREAIELCASDLRGRVLGTLSGGEKQRAMLARPLATRAPILLLDEPVSALDVRFQHEILALAKRLTRERNLATICVLHGINLAALVADSMLLLNQNGAPVAFGAPEIVMTEANLSRVYEVPLQIKPHPLSGRPQAQTLWEV